MFFHLYILNNTHRYLKVKHSITVVFQNKQMLSFLPMLIVRTLNKSIFKPILKQPHNHQHKIAKYYYATPDLIQKAIDVSVKTQREWEKVPFEKRLDIWLKAANLMATKYRQQLNASTMLGQGKTAIQAEIDSSAELIDFFKIHGYFVKDALKYKPISPDPKETLNSMRYRGMDGFVAAVSPFNFTAIGGNLSYTPALMVRILSIGFGSTTADS